MKKIALLLLVLFIGVGLSGAHIVGLLNNFMYTVSFPLVLIVMFGVLMDMRDMRSARRKNDPLLSVCRITFMATTLLYSYLATSYLLDGTFFMFGIERPSTTLWVMSGEAQVAIGFFLCVIVEALFIFSLQLWDSRSLLRRPVQLFAAI